MNNITHNNIHKAYMNKNNWIIHGITNDAINLTITTWYKITDAKYNFEIIKNVRNRTWNEKIYKMQTINQLNKW